ncbi:hypothetical protein SLS56_011694 [Neofusicoccum ribis]|uniref:DJ-1/PfpI domain-containing protein n=1 Tax=Neofusicoccum ribis TaxID=45134 RepID=A0ABR3SAX8_9PEZI
MASKTPLEVGVLLVDDAVQYTDIAPVDVLAMLTPEFVGMLGPALAPLQSQAVPMNISYIHERGTGHVTLSAANAKLAITHSLTTAPAPDILVIPGPAPVPVPRPAISAYIREAVGRGATVLSICTGALATAGSGVLDGRTATAPLVLGVLAQLRDAHPLVRWRGGRRWERSAGTGGAGDVWTSGAVFNGVDLVCAFMRARFPDSRQLVDLMVEMAGVAGRPVEYGPAESALETAYASAG